jgi:hypothetical protein
MKLSEVWTEDFGIYTAIRREAKDDFNLRKTQHDRRAARRYINALLAENDLVIWYIENSEEKMIVGTLQDMDDLELPDAPVCVETYRNRQYLEFYYIRFFSMPQRIPTIIHLDSITKFLLKNNKIHSISNKLANQG